MFLFFCAAPGVVDLVVAARAGFRLKRSQKEPGRAALLFGDRLTSLTRSLRVSNARLRATTGWAPRYPSARQGWIATAAALETVAATAS